MAIETLSYRQIGERLGCSRDAARELVKRLRLPRHMANDGKALVCIDLSEITDPQILQVLRRQVRQDRLVDLVLAESYLIPFEAQAPQPACKIHVHPAPRKAAARDCPSWLPSANASSPRRRTRSVCCAR